MPRPHSKPKPADAPKSEHAEQCDLMRWAESMTTKHSQLRLLHAIPNGGARSIATAGKLKAEGVKPGVPDLFLPVARGSSHGLYIEMKRSKGSKTSGIQKWWHMALMISGYRIEVCKSSQEAQQAILEYLNEPTPGPAILIPAPPEPKLNTAALPSKARVTDYRKTPQEARARPRLGWT